MTDLAAQISRLQRDYLTLHRTLDGVENCLKANEGSLQLGLGEYISGPVSMRRKRVSNDPIGRLQKILKRKIAEQERLRVDLPLFIRQDERALKEFQDELPGINEKLDKIVALLRSNTINEATRRWLEQQKRLHVLARANRQKNIAVLTPRIRTNRVRLRRAIDASRRMRAELANLGEHTV